MIGQSPANSPELRFLATSYDRVRRYWLWLAVFAVGVVVFVGAPGDYSGTSYAILHGLCAQTPSHTIAFGDRSLPFDSRMTGIYGGFIVTVAAIALRGRLFFHGNPPRRVVAALVLLVALMAMDGFNSLLNDLRIWHPYEPANALRVITGYGVGLALGVALCWLLASSVWNMSSPAMAVRGFGDLLAPAIGLVCYGMVLWASPSWLHLPVSIILVLSAWLTVSMLVLVMVLLSLKLDAHVRRMQHLHVPVAISALLAVSVMMGLSGLRYWAEHTLGISNALM